MNFAGMVACILVGLDCLQRGAGVLKQDLFGSSSIWLWYVVALIWFVTAIQFLLHMLGGTQNR